VKLAGAPANAWTDWTPQSTNRCWNSTQNQCSGADGTITVNNVPAGATVWVTVHLDYKLKGTTVGSDFLKKPIVYGMFASHVMIREQQSGAWVGVSSSGTTLIGRGKKVTLVYGTATDASGAVMPNVWVQLKQGANTAQARTDSTGFYLFYDGQACTMTDGLEGGCTGASTTTWTFASGTSSSSLTIHGQGATATGTPSFPAGWTKADVRSATALLQTVTTPTYTFGIAKGAAYDRSWQFRN
jgi:hypothetical protein